MFQNPEAGFVADTVEDELTYARAPRLERASIARHTENLLERFGLTALRRANPFTLSEGQKRRLSVQRRWCSARALCCRRAHVWPGSPIRAGADGRDSRAHPAGSGGMVATHDLSLVSEVADRVVALADGEVVFDGTPADLIADPHCSSGRPADATAAPGARRALARGAHVPRSLSGARCQLLGSRGTGVNPFSYEVDSWLHRRNPRPSWPRTWCSRC